MPKRFIVHGGCDLLLSAIFSLILSWNWNLIIV